MKYGAVFLAGVVLTLAVVLFWQRGRHEPTVKEFPWREESLTSVQQIKPEVGSNQNVGHNTVKQLAQQTPPPTANSSDVVAELSQGRYIWTDCCRGTMSDKLIMNAPGGLHYCSNRLQVTTSVGSANFYPAGWSDTSFILYYQVTGGGIFQPGASLGFILNLKWVSDRSQHPECLPPLVGSTKLTQHRDGDFYWWTP
jgi:hypothetical protein